MQPHQRIEDATKVSSAIIALLEGRVTDELGQQLAEKLREVPLKYWRVGIGQDGLRANWSVTAALPASYSLPTAAAGSRPEPECGTLHVHLSRTFSFVPNDNGISEQEIFSGSIEYPTQIIAPISKVNLADRPQLVTDLIDTLSRSLGEIEALQARWVRVTAQARTLAEHEYAAVMQLREMTQRRVPPSPCSDEDARLLLQDQIWKMDDARSGEESAVGFELVKILGSSSLQLGTTCAQIAIGLVHQIDEHGNETPFELAVAAVTGVVSKTDGDTTFKYTVVAMSDFSRIGIGMFRALVIPHAQIEEE